MSEILTKSAAVPAFYTSPRRIIRFFKSQYVYFANIIGTPFIKIGMAVSPEKRLKEIQVGCPCEIKIIGWVKCNNPYDLEQYLHLRFKKKRCFGEWFLVVKDDLQTLLNSLKSRKQVSFDDLWWKNYCETYPTQFVGEPSENAKYLLAAATHESFSIEEVNYGT